MKNDEYKADLKEQYLGQIRPLKTVNSVISIFQQEMDIIEINEYDLSDYEKPHFRFLRFNYSKNINIDINEVEFVFLMVEKNERSEQYYELMQYEAERIIIVIENKANLITSNCGVLSIDLQIERGIEKTHIDQDTTELIAYLTLFDFRSQV